MPAKDIYHNVVVQALTKDRWTITDDPLRLQWGSRDLYVDLGAEQLLAAEKDSRKIAVEIKSFISASPVADLETVLGRYILYQDILARLDPERILYLAIRQEVFLDLFTEPIGKVLLENNRLRLLVFDPEQGAIAQWIP